MPSSKATKLEPQTHESDEREAVKIPNEKKRKYVDEFSKKKTNDSSIYNI